MTKNSHGMIAVDKIGTKVLFLNPATYETEVVLDDQGTATIMRGTGSDPNHIAYRSVYPDASIAETFDRISATEYRLHATVRSGGKTITNVDTCLRGAH